MSQWHPQGYQSQAEARQLDSEPSDYGLDCCEDGRTLSNGGLRYMWLLGECPGCGMLEGTIMPVGWSGPVRGGE